MGNSTVAPGSCLRVRDQIGQLGLGGLQHRNSRDLTDTETKVRVGGALTWSIVNNRGVELRPGRLADQFRSAVLSRVVYTIYIPVGILPTGVIRQGARL